MVNLDNQIEIRNLDSGKVAESIENLPKQIEQAWKEASQIEIPAEYKKVKNVVVSGMGGSALGADIIRNLFKEKLIVPFLINNHYRLPGFVNEDTLVILSSYSGTTEETIAGIEEVMLRKAKILIITSGGELGARANVKGFPSYHFSPQFNPSAQPRLGLGYTFVGTLAILVKLELLNLSSDQLEAASLESSEVGKDFLVDSATERNQTKQMAKKLFGNLVVYVAGEFLSGNAHVFANQTNENSKNFATYFLIPELNHHLLEGNTYPESVKKDIRFLFLESSLYSEKIQKRIAVTKEVLNKQKITTESYNLQSSNQLAQVFEAILFSSWTTFYLGLLYGVDPTKIPWVDYFKKQLGK
jgi:glucose/mannose-6-phosphate isomerase